MWNTNLCKMWNTNHEVYFTEPSHSILDNNLSPTCLFVTFDPVQHGVAMQDPDKYTNVMPGSTGLTGSKTSRNRTLCLRFGGTVDGHSHNGKNAPYNINWLARMLITGLSNVVTLKVDLSMAYFLDTSVARRTVNFFIAILTAICQTSTQKKLVSAGKADDNKSTDVCTAGNLSIYTNVMSSSARLTASKTSRNWTLRLRFGGTLDGCGRHNGKNAPGAFSGSKSCSGHDLVQFSHSPTLATKHHADFQLYMEACLAYSKLGVVGKILVDDHQFFKTSVSEEAPRTVCAKTLTKVSSHLRERWSTQCKRLSVREFYFYLA